MRRMINKKGQDWVKSLENHIAQDGNTTEVGGNLEVDGVITANGGVNLSLTELTLAEAKALPAGSLIFIELLTVDGVEIYSLAISRKTTAYANYFATSNVFNSNDVINIIGISISEDNTISGIDTDTSITSFTFNETIKFFKF